MTQLPNDLALRLESIFLKSEMKILEPALAQEKRLVSFRINLLQSNAEEIELALEKASITYTKPEFPENCYLLDESFSESDLWRLKIYKKGKIYIQSISSQIPVNYFGSALIQFSPDGRNEAASNKPLRILDACAAPGGKTSQLAEKFPDAEIFAFEPSKVRYEKMIHNFEKLGISITESSSQDTSLNSLLQGERENKSVICIYDSIENIGKHIQPSYNFLPEGEMGLQYFDMILVDAPCSNEGSLSLHNTKFLENWDITHIKKNYKRQKRICDSVVPYLKSGGELIYSTCTLAPEENEAVIHYLLCNYSELRLEKIELEENTFIKTKEALKSFGKHPYKKEISKHGKRVIPSEFSEGFFIAKLLKKRCIY